MLYLVALALLGAASALIRSPGYMDAEYYFTTGRELAGGRGFQEPFLWNYLDDPQGLPHASHRYWMPLASLLAAVGIRIGGEGFRAAQAPFLLMAAGLPVLTYAIAWRLYRDRRKSRIAGGLALVPGLFLPFLLTTDTFGMYALLAGGALVLMATDASDWRWPLAALVGALIGLAHLARADGLLLWFPLFFCLRRQRAQRAGLAAASVLGYAAIMTPWLLRNLLQTGVLWPPGAGRTLWLLSYDETFSYPASLLTAGRWWSAGFTKLLSDRLAAASTNVRSLLIVNGLVFLAPLMMLGAWRLRREVMLQTAGIYMALLLVAMSFVFPYAGARGGFFHSSAAMAPILLALVPQGLEDFTRWGERVRGWERLRAAPRFLFMAPLLPVVFTAWATWSRITANGKGAGWERNARTFGVAGEAIPESTGLLAVIYPPALYAATSLPSVVIPNGDAEVLRSVVERYRVEWVLLEKDHPKNLEALYVEGLGNDFLEPPVRLQDADGALLLLFHVKP